MFGKLVCGVGVYTKGKYKSSIELVSTRESRLWRNMLERCYNEKSLIKHPTYSGCTVSENFKNFQYFAEWCNSQVGFGIRGYQLDKDLIVRGNKVYSEDTCVFVPKELNLLLGQNTVSRGLLPIGVSWREDAKKYAANLRVDSRGKHIGLYRTKDEAFSAYKLAKELRVKQVAAKYKGHVDDRVYHALMSYEVSIND